MFDFAVKGPDQNSGEDTEQHDAVGIAQTFAAVTQVARHILVLGQDGQQRRQAVVGGVGRQIQDQHGRDLDVIIKPVAAENIFGEQGQHRHIVLGQDMVVKNQK